MDNSFRLMTANLLHEWCDANDFARVLEEIDPDVLITQELGPQCARIIKSAFPAHQLRPALDFSGRGIATRFETSFGEIDMPGRPGSTARLAIGSRDINLAGIHLLNPVTFPWWASVRARRRQLDGLFSWLDEWLPGPVVVAGDFNASPAWPAYRMVADRLDDLVAEHSRRAGVPAERTWAWRPGWPRLLRIDHVFGSGLTATGVSVRPIAGSDHAAVAVDMELPPE